ncbi:MAG: DUF255 domain-containing protein [Planctomycetes bacterium]|nr:DUF255 domain-containing protein [Planctomycetota bacterium]
MPFEPANRQRNRLAGEGSAYLRQHSGNPVDWWAWGQQAIDEARRRDVPLLVSVGYSTCHWCHVMEHESFSNAAIAAVMDRHCVCVKVDREARPDLDAVWMTACQVFTAVTEGRPSGGWPLHVFLTPDTLEPFFAGTYYPPEPGFGRMAFPDLVQRLALAWKDRRDEVRKQGAEIARLVRVEMALSEDRRPLDEALEGAAARALVGFHDRVHGGFGGAPKFPQPALLRFLQSRTDDAAAAEVVHRSLERMAMGGVRDQLDGGFHRYAVDASWTVPHFEKMLYDQGQLLTVCARAANRDSFLARVTGELADFLVGVMREPHGGFVAALDADANGREGSAHVWYPEEVEAALVKGACSEHLAMVVQAFGLEKSANFRDPHHPHERPSWVLALQDRPETLAARAGCFEGPWWNAFDRARAAMLAARATRPQPFRDDAVIAAWNGLAIEGLAEASIALKRDDLRTAAERAAAFVLGSLRTADGTLGRSWRAGVVSGAAYLEDHACMALGLLSLHRAGGDGRWLREAEALLDATVSRFWSDEHGFVEAPADALGRIAPVGGVDDGAMPSGAGAACEALAMCAAASGVARWADLAMRALERASGTVAARPTGSPHSLLAARTLRGMVSPRVPGAIDAGPVQVELVALDGMGERFELRWRIASGHHVNAHDPGTSGLVGLDVQPRDEGVRVEVAWPAGEAHASGVRLHTGQVAVPVRVLAPRPTPRPLRLTVRWQCCTDRECLAPQSRQLEA